MFASEESLIESGFNAWNAFATYSPYVGAAVGTAILLKMLSPVVNGTKNAVRTARNLSPAGVAFLSLLCGPLAAEMLSPQFGANGTVAAYSGATFLFAMGMVAQIRRWTGKTSLNTSDIEEMNKILHVMGTALKDGQIGLAREKHGQAEKVLERVT